MKATTRKFEGNNRTLSKTFQPSLRPAVWNIPRKKIKFESTDESDCKHQIASFLSFPNNNEIPNSEGLNSSSEMGTTDVDKLFFINSDIDLSENPKEITLQGMDQLPKLTNHLVKGALTSEKMSNFLSTLAELSNSRL